MSQAGIVDFIQTHPQLPTTFVTDSGSAIPIANTLEILGTVVAAHGIPLETTGSGNTVTVAVQYASSAASSFGTNAGVASFRSSDFNVDANGFVTISALAGATEMGVDTFTAPGTNPVLPNGSGVITVTGGQVPAGTTTNVIRTNSLAINTYTIEIQRSQAVASSTIGDNGVSHFNSSHFSVDANGFVSLAGSGQAIDSIGTQTGTNPIVPTAGGLVTINGAVVAAGTNPVRSDGTGANTMAIEVQISQAIAATDATKIGLSNFNSAHFSVDANGFVALVGGGQAVDSFSPDSGTDPVVPTVAGLVNDKGSGSITTVGSLNTITTQLTGLTNHAVLVGAGTTTITKLAVGTNGQVLIGATAADPAFATITSTGGTIAFTLGANTLNMDVVDAGFAWTNVTGTSATMVKENAYQANNAGLVTLTMPSVASSTFGDTIRVGGFGAGGWAIQCVATQLIHYGATATSAAGTLVSTNRYDQVELVCSSTTTEWFVRYVIGNLGST